MKLPLVTTLLSLFATGAQAACGDYHIEDPGAEFTLECEHYACNVLELDANNNILGRQGVDPVGQGASCIIKIRVYGDGGTFDIGNHENTATIEHSGAVTCDSFSIGVSKAGLSASITCSVENQVFNTVEGNFQAWCGNELPDERVEGGTISGSCLNNYVSCYGWTRASDFGKVDPHEDNPICYESGLE